MCLTALQSAGGASNKLQAWLHQQVTQLDLGCCCPEKKKRLRVSASECSRRQIVDLLEEIEKLQRSIPGIDIGSCRKG